MKLQRLVLVRLQIMSKLYLVPIALAELSDCIMSANATFGIVFAKFQEWEKLVIMPLNLAAEITVTIPTIGILVCLSTIGTVQHVTVISSTTLSLNLDMC